METERVNQACLSDPTIRHLTQRHRYTAPNKTTRRWVHCGQAEATTFERFLCWLGPNPESAGLKYEAIRSRLIMMFKARRCIFAEDLADATIERVARKLTDTNFQFAGDPAFYFYGVAKKIYLEHKRAPTVDYCGQDFYLPSNSHDDLLEERLRQLDQALNTISKTDRELILRYYDCQTNNIKQRRALANELGIPPNALRLRVFRIRKELKNQLAGSSKEATDRGGAAFLPGFEPQNATETPQPKRAKCFSLKRHNS